MGRVNTLLPAPADPKYKLVHVGFTSPGGDAFNTDKDKHGFRYDSIGICNGVVNAGGRAIPQPKLTDPSSRK